MSFVVRLRPELICIDPPWRSFDAAVAGLVDRLVAAGPVAPEQASDVVRALRAREAESATAILEIGVGVPHARLPDLATPGVALGLSPRGFYEAAPTVPIHILALVLSPVRATEEHLRMLAGIATLLRSTELRGALLRAPSPLDALAALTRAARTAP